MQAIDYVPPYSQTKSCLRSVCEASQTSGCYGQFWSGSDGDPRVILRRMARTGQPLYRSVIRRCGLGRI